MTAPAVRENQIDEVAVVEGELIHLSLRDNLGHGCAVGIQSDSVGLHFHKFGYRASFQVTSARACCADHQADVIRHGLLESSRLHRYPVGSRLQEGRRIIAR